MLPTFSAAATLVDYGDLCKCGTEHRHKDHVAKVILYFDRFRKRSVYAACAADVLRSLVRERQAPGLEGSNRYFHAGQSEAD